MRHALDRVVGVRRAYFDAERPGGEEPVGHLIQWPPSRSWLAIEHGADGLSARGKTAAMIVPLPRRDLSQTN
jgi:hypothetical protein